MPQPITQSDMEAVFAVTDDLGIHRESVTVHLAKRDPGAITEKQGHVTISLPESTPAEEWAAETIRTELNRLGFEDLP